VPDIAFLALSGFVVVSAIFALEAKELIYGAIGLAFSLIGVAGVFILLGAEYLAMFQIAVYVGAVVVLILFTIMLVQRESGQIVEQEEPGLLGRAGAYVAVLVALAVAAAVIFLVPLSTEAPKSYQVSLQELGRFMASSYSAALLILGLLIGATVVGALTLTKVDREEKPGGTAH
jgi:NADH:ubiquinone oxidoreductase subunit 6 (subunit J)